MDGQKSTETCLAVMSAAGIAVILLEKDGNAMLLKGKICLVTGSNRGIGASVIRMFAQEGAVVYANARKSGSLDSVCDSYAQEYKTEVIPLYFNVCDEAEVKKAFIQIQKRHGTLDVLVNNAGIMRDAVIGMIDRNMLAEIFDVNVFSVISLMQYAKKLMSRKKKGSIINLSSIVGIEGNAGQTAYAASKGAVAALTKSAAKEMAGEGIRVNAVAPGIIDTDMFRSIGEQKAEEYRKRIRLGRFGRPEDVAKACVFLASDLSEYITGEILGVNGGEQI